MNHNFIALDIATAKSFPPAKSGGNTGRRTSPAR